MHESLRRSGASQCHILHYLQMAAEKIGKAYFWRSGSPSGKLSHATFTPFLRAITSTRAAKNAVVFDFDGEAKFVNWVKRVTPMARRLEELAPAVGGDGPNAEYPWPHDMPTSCPAAFDFPIWAILQAHGDGRNLLRFIGHAVNRFEQFA